MQRTPIVGQITFCFSYKGRLLQGADLLSKDCSAGFKQRFANRYAGGATITMLQDDFGIMKALRSQL